VIDQYISGRSCDDANHLGIVDNARQNPKKIQYLKILSGLIQTVFLLKIYEIKL